MPVAKSPAEFKLLKQGGRGRFNTPGHSVTCSGMMEWHVRYINGAYRITYTCVCGSERNIERMRYKTFDKANAAIERKGHEQVSQAQAAAVNSAIAAGGRRRAG